MHKKPGYQGTGFPSADEPLLAAASEVIIAWIANLG